MNITDRNGNTYHIIEKARWTVTIKGSAPQRRVTVRDTEGKERTLWCDPAVTCVLYGTLDKRSGFRV